MKRLKANRHGKVSYKLAIAFLVIVFLLVSIGVNLLNKREKRDDLDYKFGVIADDGIALVSISKERRMVNVLKLENNSEVWISNGDGWQKVDELKKKLNGKNRDSLAKSIFWYNFGFVSDKVLFLNSVGDWNKDSVLFGNLGWWNFISYKINYGKMLLKEEKVDGNLNENTSNFDEILARDFSESRLSNEELRLSIYNDTEEVGLAGFMAQRLEWSGFSVVGADNNSEKINNCLIVYGKKSDLNYGWKVINKLFDCEKKANENLNENEVELYFGDSFASMIQYQTYGKANPN